MARATVLAGAIWLVVLPAAAAEKTENKNITVLTTQSTADGETQVWKEVLEECVAELPPASALEPEVTSQTLFLKEINGQEGRNDHTRVYSAKLAVNYMLYQKVLIVVSSRTVQAQEPILKEVERRVRQSKTFESNASDGDLYAGRSNRKYYFSTPQAAAKDVLERAKVWLKQQTGASCSGN